LGQLVNKEKEEIKYGILLEAFFRQTEDINKREIGCSMENCTRKPPEMGFSAERDVSSLVPDYRT